MAYLMSLMNDNVNRRGLDTFDWCFLGVILGIISAGILSIYSVTNSHSITGFPVYLKQAIWVVAGCMAFLIAAGIDYHKFARLSYVLYGIGLILLIIVLIAGKTSRGSQRWIPLGPFVVQPSEFIKIPLILTLAAYYGTTSREGWMRRLFVPVLIVLPGFLLILKQPDLGSSLGFLAIFGRSDGGHEIQSLRVCHPGRPHVIPFRLGRSMGLAPRLSTGSYSQFC